MIKTDTFKGLSPALATDATDVTEVIMAEDCGTRIQIVTHTPLTHLTPMDTLRFAEQLATLAKQQIDLLGIKQ